MMSLFNSFDQNFFSSQFYLMAMFLILFSFSDFKINFYMFLNNEFFKMVSLFLSSLKPKSYNEFSILSILSIFVFLILLNFSSVFSYTFPFSSQTSVVIFFSFSFWFSFFMFQTFQNMKGFISHCVPEGTPIYLTWFLFLIETVSNFIRPITLMVRLVANILAGHLLMILLSKLVMKMLILIPLFLGLNLVELFVALIQSYIFITMTTLYFSDVN